MGAHLQQRHPIAELRHHYARYQIALSSRGSASAAYCAVGAVLHTARSCEPQLIM